MDKPKKELPQAMKDKQFKPGQSGNPEGPKALTPEEKKLRRMSRQQFAEVAEMIVQGNWSSLLEVEKDPNSTVLQKLMAKALQESHKRGDWSMIDRLLDRLIGKPKDDMQVTFLRRVVKKLNGEEIVYTNEPEDE